MGLEKTTTIKILIRAIASYIGKNNRWSAGELGNIDVMLQPEKAKAHNRVYP